MCSRASRRVADRRSFCETAWASWPFVSSTRSSRVRTRLGASWSRRRRTTTSSSSVFSCDWRSPTSRSYSASRRSCSEATPSPPGKLSRASRRTLHRGFDRSVPPLQRLDERSDFPCFGLRNPPAQATLGVRGRQSGGILRKDIMKVWIDQDLCTGDGLCEEIAPRSSLSSTTAWPMSRKATRSTATRAGPTGWPRSRMAWKRP